MSRRAFPVVAAVTAALLLAGCQTLGRKPAVIEPPAPAAEAAPAMSSPDAGLSQAPNARTPCVPRTLSRAPRYPDTDAALRDAGGAADRYQLMAAGRLLRMRRLADLEKAIDACR